MTARRPLRAEPGAASEQAIAWRPSAWLRESGPLQAYRNVVEQLADVSSTSIRRQQVLDRASGPTPELLVASMIWGFGPVAYGPVRTSRMLEPPRSGQPLSDELDLIRSEARRSAADGFIALYHQHGTHAGKTRIRWLGTAFGTKFLYFAASGRMDSPESPEPLIYDALVSRALVEVAGAPQITSAQRYLSGAEYESYCRWAQDARPDGATPADVEIALFEIGRD